MGIKVLPLKGYNSLAAMNAFHRLLLGLKMLPAYFAIDYEAFYEMFSKKSDGEKETFLREAVAFVKLDREEIDSIVSFATDKNSVPLSSINTKNIPLEELFEIIVAVGMEFGKIKIRLVSEEEKKK